MRGAWGRRWGTQSRLEYIERLTNETVHFDYNDKTFEDSCSIAHNLTETVSTHGISAHNRCPC